MVTASGDYVAFPGGDGSRTGQAQLLDGLTLDILKIAGLLKWIKHLKTLWSLKKLTLSLIQTAQEVRPTGELAQATANTNSSWWWNTHNW